MIEKKAIDISFAQGLDTKSDPKRVEMGKFSQLQNMVFNKGGLLQKRNGYAQLSSLPNTNYSYLTTFNGDLTAVGQNIAAYNPGNNSFVSKGVIQPVSIDTLSLIRNNLNQTACDATIAPNGLVCTVYLEANGGSITNKYVIADSVTGQNIVAPTAIPVSSGTVSGGMRVFVLGNSFVIIFTNTITATPHLQYITISTYTPTNVSANVDIASVYAPATTVAWDAYVYGSNLYVAYNNTSGGQSVKVALLTTTLAQRASSPAVVKTYAGQIATMMSVTVDSTTTSNPIVYVSYYDSGGSTGYTLAIDQNLNPMLAPTQIIATGTYLNLASAAQNGVVTIFGEVSNTYTAGVATNYVNKRTVTLTTATVSSTVVTIRSVGLASKAFIIDSVIYFMSAYQSTYQPTYFLINGSTSLSSSPFVVGKLAYSNGGGYLPKGLPSVTVTDTSASIAYLFKDLVQSVNKGTDVPAGDPTAAVYSQTGINLATFTIGTDGLDTAEIGNVLHLTGGFFSMYDGYLPVEHNFFLWPDSEFASLATNATWSATGGSMVAQPDGATNTSAYYYQYTYEWTDNQGNAYKSAPSLPVPVTTTGNGTSGSVSIVSPTLRLTMKVANPVKIVFYRWSVAQQIYYQTTSITAPILNDTTIDSVTFVDTNADATILGNNILYTTGGVVEDVNAPASNILALFDTRLWLADAENKNLLWFSKQVIQATPVEMSDLFTMFIPPTIATATGNISSLAPMDDKLIIGKGGNSFVYINGIGPDNTGANNQYSQPIFITSTVGCSNQKSIILIPQGMMFQSNKGIWLLDRGLNTTYIGSPVENFTNGAIVQSAVSVPGTNQVRFTLDTGITLMYDYFYGQWGIFVGVPAVSSCIFQDMHTFINQYGAVYQEAIDHYLDGSNPVLMMFETGPLRLGELQGYQRAYFFYLLGNYISPHKLQVSLLYDYEIDPSQSIIISPTNYSSPFGGSSSSDLSQSPFGQGNPYGGGTNLESWRVFLQRQRCMAFAIRIQEIFDASFGVTAGAGFTLSGLNVVMGFKKGFRPQPNVNSAG